MAMSAGQKVAATVAIIGGFLLMNQCDTDSRVNQPRSTPASDGVSVGDQAGLQTAWDDQTVETQLDICAGWWEDREMATDLFYTMAIENGVEDIPERYTVQAFFDEKCN